MKAYAYTGFSSDSLRILVSVPTITTPLMVPADWTSYRACTRLGPQANILLTSRFFRHRDFWKEVPYMLSDVVSHLCSSVRPRRAAARGGYIAV